MSRENTASGVWADTAYRSKKNEAFLAKGMFTSNIHQKKPRGRAMPERIARANAKRSAVEHVFSGQKHRMWLFIRTIGIARARMTQKCPRKGRQDAKISRKPNDQDVPSGLRQPSHRNHTKIRRFFEASNWLPNRIFSSYEDIVDHCWFAWSKLVAQPGRIMSIGLPQWAHEY